MPLPAQFARFASLYRNGGARELLRRLRDRLVARGAYRAKKARDDAAFDAPGYDTGGVQHLHGLTIVGAHAASGGHHMAAPPDEFAAAMAHLDLDPAALTFIDLGSGKGRALLLAADMPFRRIVGVEFARELHDIAVANFAARARHVGPDPRVELVHGDAADYALPDEPLLLLLFNPFDPPLMTEVARNAFASWQANPRPMRVLYMYPRYADDWLAAGWRGVRGGGGAILLAPPEG